MNQNPQLFLFYYSHKFTKLSFLQSLKIWEWVMFVAKMFAFSYLGIAFNLLSIEKIIYYYNSIYHAGLIMGIVMYVSGLYIIKMKQANAKKRDKVKEGQKLE